MTRTSPLAMLASAIVLAGCDFAFHLDDPQVVGTLTHVHWPRLVATNDATGQPVTNRIADPTTELHAFTLDGTELELRAAGEDAVEFDVPAPGDPYRLVRTDTQGETELQGVAPRVDLTERGAGRVDRAPVVADSIIHFEPLPDPDGVVYGAVASTGLWTFTKVPTETCIDVWMFLWNTALSLDGPRGLLDANAHDRLFYLVYRQDSARTVVLEESAVAPTTVTEDTEFSAVPADVTVLGCAQIEPDILAERTHVQRISALFGLGESDWSVDVLPDPSTLLDHGALMVATRVQADDAAGSAMLSNPFGGTLVANTGATATRSIALPGTDTAGAVEVRIRTRSFVTLAPDVTAPCAPVPVTGRLQIPSTLSVDGHEITDQYRVTKGNRTTIPFAWTGDGEIEPDWYSIELDELAAINGISTLTARHHYVTAVPELALPADHLDPDAYYLLTITAYSGFPDARDGDYAHAATSGFRIASTAEPYFQVTP